MSQLKNKESNGQISNDTIAMSDVNNDNNSSKNKISSEK